MRALAVLAITCGCGRIEFDAVALDAPAGGSLAYPSSRAIFVYNDIDRARTRDIVSLGPVTTGAPQATFSITPDLEALTGLTFDPTTGVISGRPRLLTPFTEYTVTGTSAGGAAVATLAIRTHPGFAVDDLGDLGDTTPLDSDCVVGGRCTLRAAVEQLFTFPRDGVTRIVVLPAGTFTIGAELTVDATEVFGAGREETVIDAQYGSRVFAVASDGLATFASLTVTRGDALDGGCINALGGTVTLSDVRVLACRSTGDGSIGGGVSISDQFGNRRVNARIERCRFENNQAIGAGAQGGGLFIGTPVAGSSGEIVDTTFTGNSADVGGAISLSSGPLTLERDLFVANTGQGGALHAEGGSNITLRNSTVTSNMGIDGAGILTNNATMLTVVSSTIADNQCIGDCFSGSGLRQFSGGTLAIESSVISSNRNGNGALSNCGAFGTSGGHNLTDSPDGTECYVAASGDLAGLDPLLSPLADNGGMTLTRALGAGSPAIDAGGTACPAEDQRRVVRPQGTACDIGAFELMQ